MTQHIIDTVSKLKKECDVMCGDSPHDVRTYNEAIDDVLDAIRPLIANSPQADGMVLDVINQCAKIAEKYEPEEKLDYIDYASKEIRKLLSAYKPQADDVRKDAERYRFLREGKYIHNGEPFIARNFGASFSQWTGEYADKVIDQAIDKARE